MIGFIIIAVLLGIALVLRILLVLLKMFFNGEQTLAVVLFGLFIMIIAFLVIAFTYDPAPVPEDTQTNVSTTLDTEAYEADKFDGSSKYNPYVMWVDDFIEEIEADFDAAKKKYDGKWVSLIGVVKEEVTGSSVSGYSLGPFSQELDNGMRFVFWCEDGPYSNMDTVIQCFRGIVMEVSKDTTYFNAGEKVSS